MYMYNTCLTNLLKHFFFMHVGFTYLLGLPDILIYINMFCTFVNMYVLFV